MLRSNPTEALWFWLSGAGSAIFSAVQETDSGDGVPPVTLVTVIGVDGQLPW